MSCVCSITVATRLYLDGLVFGSKCSSTGLLLCNALLWQGDAVGLEAHVCFVGALGHGAPDLCRLVKTTICQKVDPMRALYLAFLKSMPTPGFLRFLDLGMAVNRL